jgi:hydrogen cyanide synthase HcnB
MSKPNTVIVGAGPAGLAAAIELAKHAIPSVLIDEAPKIGGVVFRGPLRAGVSLDYLGNRYKQAIEVLHGDFETHRHSIELRLNTRVIGAEDRGRLHMLEDGRRLRESPFEALILATGCHERSVPFPGWTLPGVMLLGGLQLQIKSSAVRPQGPVAIVGSGPLLPLVACQLCRAGVEVAGVFEACALNRLAREWVALLNKPQLLLDGLSMLASLKRHGVPFRYGWGIVEVRGADGVDEVVVAPYDSDWQPDLSGAETFRVSTLAMGYGFLPRTQLSQLMGLTHAYRDDGVLAPVVDNSQRASQPNVYIAGDLAGIRGGEAAVLQGRIAAMTIAAQRGAISPARAESVRREWQSQLKRIDHFHAAFNRASSPGVGLLGLLTPDTTVCRCENVARREIDKAIDQGVQDLISLKMCTRISMGDCQGKMCVGYCTARLRRATQRLDVGWIRPRFPLDPIPFGALAGPDREVAP